MTRSCPTVVPPQALPLALILATLALSRPCAAQPAPTPDEQSREADLFGDEATPVPEGPAGAEPEPQAATRTELRALEDETIDLGDPRMQGRVGERPELLRDRTDIGGLFYARQGLSWFEDVDPSDQRLSQSTLVDLYLDSKVNDRVRAYLHSRLVYDPLADVPTTAAFLAGGVVPGRDEVRVNLDQAWLKFDIQRLVFLTLGKQHVRWGATRLWNPVDVINPTRRDPLTFFDERSGLPMAKVHVPFENGWNLYALALLDNAVALDLPGLAGRVEYVIETAEVGIVGAVQRGSDPKLGLDLSAGLGEIDLTAEIGTVFTGGDTEWQSSVGASWTWAYAEDDTLTFAAEYFHNDQGIANEADVVARAWDAKVAGSAITLTPFYIGRDYAAIVASLGSPGTWKDSSFTLSALGNLSDESGLARLDFRTSVLTDMSLEAFVSAYLGDGEFTGYTSAVRDHAILGPLTAKSSSGRPLAAAGVNLRVKL